MIKKITIIILLILAGIITKANEGITKEKIDGAFGFKLGEKYNITKNKIVMMYPIKKPKKPFRKFTRYDISVTRDQKIFLIRAEFQAKNEEEAIAELAILENSITKKYKTITRKAKNNDDIYFVEIVNEEQNRSIGIVKDKTTIRIMYRDNELGKEQNGKNENRRNEKELQEDIKNAKEIL